LRGAIEAHRKREQPLGIRVCIAQPLWKHLRRFTDRFIRPACRNECERMQNAQPPDRIVVAISELLERSVGSRECCLPVAAIVCLARVLVGEIRRQRCCRNNRQQQRRESTTENTPNRSFHRRTPPESRRSDTRAPSAAC